MIAPAPRLLCYPPAPLNGGALESAPAKVGAWAWQPKVDDWRAVIHTPTRTVWNQYGELSSFMDTDKFSAALTQLERLSFAVQWLDVGMMNNRNDMMRGSIVVIDAMISGGHALRRHFLASMFTALPWATELVGTADAHERVYLIPEVAGETEGRALYQACKDQNSALGRKFYEGVVAKQRDSSYPSFARPKQKFASWIKSRFDQS